MPQRFFGKEIKVTTSGEVKAPASFELDGEEHVIAEVLESWPDRGFGRIVLPQRKWLQRHHRNYYRVKTTDGELYEIYYDRGVSLKNPEYKKWYVTRRL